MEAHWSPGTVWSNWPGVTEILDIGVCIGVCVCAAQQQGVTLLSDDSMKLLYLCIITSLGLLLGCLVTLDFNFCNLPPVRRPDTPGS